MPDSELQGPWTKQITVRIGVASVIAVIAITIGATYSLTDDATQRANIEFIAKVLFGGAALYSAYHAGAAFRLNLLRDQQKQAYAILDSYNRVDTVKARIAIDEDMKKEFRPSEAYKRICDDPQKHAVVRSLLGVFEDMAIAIRLGFADERVLYTSLASITVFYYDGLKAYITGVREEFDKGQRLTFYTEIEGLANKWRNGESIMTGKVFGK